MVRFVTKAGSRRCVYRFPRTAAAVVADCDSERKNVATSSSNILPTTDEKKSNAMNELRRKQSSERIHARCCRSRGVKTVQVVANQRRVGRVIRTRRFSFFRAEENEYDDRGPHRPRRVSLSKRLHLYICPLPLKKKKKTKKKKKKKKKKPSSFPTRKNQTNDLAEAGDVLRRQEKSRS